MSKVVRPFLKREGELFGGLYTYRRLKETMMVLSKMGAEEGM